MGWISRISMIFLSLYAGVGVGFITFNVCDSVTARLIGIEDNRVQWGEYIVCQIAGVASTFLVLREYWPCDPPRLRVLSLPAKLAIGLHCFTDYCRVMGLQHIEIDKFVDDLWEYPVIIYHKWADWEDGHPGLYHAAYGETWPAGFESFLESKGVNPKEFRELIWDVVAIVSTSFYAASDNHASCLHLRKLIKSVAAAGVAPLSSRLFVESRFADRNGMGKNITAAQRNEWRQFGANNETTNKLA